ncbi:hypothetical protein MAP00_008915 [Monascus purpureus]|nr:hypothetical protein MAP00_008915 [Monascus purpureus]
MALAPCVPVGICHLFRPTDHWTPRNAALTGPTDAADDLLCGTLSVLCRGFHSLVPANQNTASGATVFVFVLQIFYGVGWLPVASEINTTRPRARAWMQAIALGWNWMAVFAVVKDYAYCI